MLEIEQTHMSAIGDGLSFMIIEQRSSLEPDAYRQQLRLPLPIAQSAPASVPPRYAATISVPIETTTRSDHDVVAAALEAIDVIVLGEGIPASITVVDEGEEDGDVYVWRLGADDPDELLRFACDVTDRAAAPSGTRVVITDQRDERTYAERVV